MLEILEKSPDFKIEVIEHCFHMTGTILDDNSM